MKVWALFVTHRTGYVQVLTFPTAFDRAMHVLELASAPVVLRIQDYV